MAVKILAVDDSATMRMILEMTFAGEDAEVVSAQSGAEGLQKAAQVQPDVVFADASMDGTDGYALCQQLRSAGSTAALIILSSQHTPYDVAKGKASGVDDHVAKPFDTQIVIDKVKALVAARPAAAAAPPRPAPPAAPARPAAPAAPARPV
ncbi:MAG: response regulator, partial [Myxococcales bacterium]|nr:response regulator [Myxococcales bacterium]